MSIVFAIADYITLTEVYKNNEIRGIEKIGHWGNVQVHHLFIQRVISCIEPN